MPERLFVVTIFAIFGNMIDSGDVQKPQIEETRQTPLPEQFRRGKVLEAPEEQLLQQQWQEFNRLRSIPITRNPLLERAQAGKPELAQGTLLHGTEYSPEKMKSIKKTGILSAEFTGGIEDAETYYCADFFRVPKDMTIQEYQEWITTAQHKGRLIQPKMERSKLATPNNKSKMMSLIVDSQQPELAMLLQQDAYSEKADPRLRKIASNLLDPKGDEHTRRLAAILCGIPSNFINGIIVNPGLINEDITELRTTFGNNVAIYSSSGEMLK